MKFLINLFTIFLLFKLNGCQTTESATTASSGDCDLNFLQNVNLNIINATAWDEYLDTIAACVAQSRGLASLPRNFTFESCDEIMCALQCTTTSVSLVRILSFLRF